MNAWINKLTNLLINQSNLLINQSAISLLNQSMKQSIRQLINPLFSKNKQWI